MIYLLVVACSDAAIAFTAGRYQDARIERNCRDAVLWDAVLALFIAINTIAIIEMSWRAVPWSIGGTMVGTALSFLHPQARR